MMVADMQRELTEALLDQGKACAGPVFDPFVGSGTIVGSGMALGRDVVGWDVNPLAILICRVKAGPFHLTAFEAAASRVVPSREPRGAVEERFDNWKHWFTEDVARGLTALRRKIRSEPNLPTRRFLWICLAETIRLTSNSRTSTVKLHRRPEEQIERRPDPRDVFARVARENLTRLEEAASELNEKGFLSRGWYKGVVDLRLGDSRRLAWSGPLSAVMVTSPPYGDNTSTVPYGQHSYLPLQWIDLCDIDPVADATCLASTYEIDRQSLGGTKRIGSDVAERLSQRSAAVEKVLAGLEEEKQDRRSRVLAFTRDLDEALKALAPTIVLGSCAAWTVGSRRVGGMPVPLDRILIELSAAYGFVHVETLARDIPLHRKRMAARNSAGATMHREHVVVLRRVRN
jgi:hypothetical protein